MAQRIDILTRIRCFLCNRYAFPWEILKENGEWVCRVCINYEGNYRLPYTIENAREMKRRLRDLLVVEYEEVDNIAFHVRPNHPVVATMPANYTYQADRPTAPINYSAPETRHLNTYLGVGRGRPHPYAPQARVPTPAETRARVPPCAETRARVSNVSETMARVPTTGASVSNSTSGVATSMSHTARTMTLTYASISSARSNEDSTDE